MFFKEPIEVSTFQIDWVDWLSLLTIVSSSWTAPTGITIDSNTFTAKTTSVTLSGGTWGETYEISNTIITSDAQTETRSILVRIQRSVSYCSSGEVRRRLAKDTTSTTTLTPTELDALIEQASRYLDLLCGVEAGHFNPSPIPIAQARTFYGDGTHYLKLDPYVSLSSITFPDGFAVPDYVERQGYLLTSSQTGVLPTFTDTLWWPWIGGWPEGVPVTVTAIWGFLETPADVKMATIELVINLFRETDPAELNLIDLERQPLREKIPPRVAEVINRYRNKVDPVFV